jgi:hypothetical protein
MSPRSLDCSSGKIPDDRATHVLQWQSLGRNHDVGWRLWAIAAPAQNPIAKDFNGDSYSDLVLENVASGARTIWLLKNGIYLSSIALPSVVPD